MIETYEKCDCCLWADQCQALNECSQFTPIDEDCSVETAIEDGKYEFRHVNYIYVKDYD